MNDTHVGPAAGAGPGTDGTAEAPAASGAGAEAVSEADVVIVGAGAAGLSLAERLSDPAYGTPGPSVCLVEAAPGPLRPGGRTWCFWEPAAGDLDDLVAASWPRLRVTAPDGRVVERALGPLRYKMIRSSDFEEEMGRRLAARGTVRRLTATVTSVADAPVTDAPGGGARVRCRTSEGRAHTVRARWAFDSRPLRPLPPARTTLLQHFRGWLVRSPRALFDPSAAVWMDFRTPQPAHGLSFGYLLPLTPHQALVEYTEFSPRVLTTDAYERALDHYTGRVLGLTGTEVVAAEQGVIPMTDARFPRRTGSAVFRIGTAGGATRPATGYTFAAIRRQARAVAAAHRAGRTPLPPPAHSRRSRAMDAVLLRALATGRVEGADFFACLFARNPVQRLLRFLDGRSRPWEDALIGLSIPALPMLRSAAELPLLPRR